MKNRNYITFRILTSLIFLFAGFGHIFQADKIFGKFSKLKFYSFMPEESFTLALIYFSGIVMFAAGALLAAGWHEKKAAIILLFILIPITLSVQLDNLRDLGPFFKNVAIAGSLLFIINYKQNEIKNPAISHGSPAN